MKIEWTRINYLGDVFAAVAVDLVKVPITFSPR